MTVRIINKSKHPLPAYATELSAGMDIRANLSEPIALEPLQRCLVPTGLYIALPAGFEAQIRPRSGLAIKKGISVLNSPGTIDADYRGEICIILVNLSSETFMILKCFLILIAPNRKNVYLTAMAKKCLKSLKICGYLWKTNILTFMI